MDHSYLGKEYNSEGDAGTEYDNAGEKGEERIWIISEREADSSSGGWQNEHVVDTDADQLAVIDRRNGHLFQSSNESDEGISWFFLTGTPIPPGRDGFWSFK